MDYFPNLHIYLHTLSDLEEMIHNDDFLRKKMKQHTEKYMLLRVHYSCYYYHSYSAQDTLKYRGLDKYPLEISQLYDSVLPRGNILLN